MLVKSWSNISQRLATGFQCTIMCPSMGFVLFQAESVLPRFESVWSEPIKEECVHKQEKDQPHITLVFLNNNDTTTTITSGLSVVLASVVIFVILFVQLRKWISTGDTEQHTFSSSVGGGQKVL